MSKARALEKYSPDEIEQQKRYLSHAKGIGELEKKFVLKKLNEGDVDSGTFRWVKCPVWRYRMYQVVERKMVSAETLNRIMRYILEGERIE